MDSQEPLPWHEPTQDGFRVRWRSITTLLSITTAVSASTLVIVVSIKNVDILSTVALALAILAFAAQLIVSLTQAQQATSQQTQSERINSETKSALSEIRSTSQALLSNQTGLFDKILDAALPGATRAAIDEVTGSSESDSKDTAGFDHDELARNFERRVRDAIRDLSPSSLVQSGATSEQSSTWVDKQLSRSERLRARSILNTLTTMQLASFCSSMIPIYVRGTRNFSESIGYRFKEESQVQRYQELEERGLIELRQTVEHKGELSLTPDGVVLLRLLAGRGTARNFFTSGDGAEPMG